MAHREAEAARRRERALREGLRAERVSGTLAAGRYRVSSPSGRSHMVRLRFARGALHRCDCQDYETKGLGTCKHIEAALMALQQELGPAGLEGLRRQALEPSWRHGALGPGVLYLDLETQRVFEEVGGRHHLDRLGISVAVTYCEAEGGFVEYREERAVELVQRLLRSPLVVGFNVLRFDYEVLSGYTPDADLLYTVPTLDMMAELEGALGFRVGLDTLAREMLGIPKAAGGLAAVRWFREGQWDQLVQYCRSDVELTRRVLEASLQEGRVRVTDRQGRVVEVAVPWAELARAA